jgi:diguanylate cyclase (GGDEF)-like protein/PAS domain S-box-containing protein
VPVPVSSKMNSLRFIPGLLALILGILGLFGWFFNVPALTRILSNWNPMVPSTALCFILSGLALLKCKSSTDQNASLLQRVLILLILLLAGARAVELATGRNFGIEFLITAWGAEPSGHMSPQTMLGFLIFAAGILAMRRSEQRRFALLARALALTLLVIGVGASVGYLLNLNIIFEGVYVATGLIWMSLPTAIGMTLLGIGLWNQLYRMTQTGERISVSMRATQINRAIIIALIVTSLATGVTGLVFLDRSITQQASVNIQQLLQSRRDFIENTIEYHTRHAELAASSSRLHNALIHMLDQHQDKDAMTQAIAATSELLTQGFSGIGLDQAGKRRVLAGTLLPASTSTSRLHAPQVTELAWHQGYYLRLRISLSQAGRDMPGVRLILEQPLPELDKLFDDAIHWGKTGNMVMCARQDQTLLLCFPHRENNAMSTVPDKFQGEPIPMEYALANQSGIRKLLDYRGHNVLAAYTPVGTTGLGLILRMDLAELYAPAKDELEFALPFLALLVGLGLWLIRLRVKPLLQDLVDAHIAEKGLLQKLDYSNRLRNTILESAAYSIISTDVNGVILTFNHAAERMLWYRAEEMIEKATPEIFHDADEVKERAQSLSQELGYPVTPGFEVFVAKAKRDFQEEREWTYVRKDGSRFPVRLSVTALRDENDVLQGYLGIAYDISEQKRAEEYIRHIALHDVLTGLPNRALLEDRLIMAIEKQRRTKLPFALAMLDIDRFKHINDTMGHHIGDRLLKEFVSRIKSCLRPTDTIARMGGDEFMLLLPETDVKAAEQIMARILESLTQSIDVEVQKLHITSSIGISICPRDGVHTHELMRCADVAMYWVKEHGRNGYKVYSRKMDSHGADRLRLEQNLHDALDNDGFTLFYQPKVDLKTNTVFSVEALLRMPNASGQLNSPAEFIPLAEEIGLIIPIGQWVLKTACRDAVRLHKALGAPLTMAINISARQFMSGDLLGTIHHALQDTQLNASQLELEITESILMDERIDVSNALHDLRNLGVNIAIDDFGTGYSSLSYLKRFKINELKIDQSFVRDMTNDSEDAALVAAIIAMGHSLNIAVVAEGIETTEQLAFLTANDCDMAQGFFIGRPLSFDELLQWFANETRWKLVS